MKILFVHCDLLATAPKQKAAVKFSFLLFFVFVYEQDFYVVIVRL